MPRIFIKPVFWNFKNYIRPTGAKATSGYPADWGFGHEEWNNSPHNNFDEDGRPFRIFHIEGLGKFSDDSKTHSEADSCAGDILIFMVASYRGTQYLVGIAAECTKVRADERRRLVDALNLYGRWKDAWRLDIVQSKFGYDQQAFLQKWRRELHWLPNWKCPASSFVWLEKPAPIDPRAITGKKKLALRYSSFKEIDSATAACIVATARIDPIDQHSIAGFRAKIDNSQQDVEKDVAKIRADKSLPETTRQALIDARRGQGRFRQQVLKKWGDRCAVTGCAVLEALRASHVRPWRDSNNKQRLDPNNGLPLIANLDALFDRGMISFSAHGKMLIRRALSDGDRRALGLGGSLQSQLNKEQHRHLKFHREMHFGRRSKQ
jgi:hypothetical protein